MLWAVAASAFYGLLHLGELLPESGSAWNVTANLAWGTYVVVDSLSSPTMVQIHLKRSKGDQEGHDANIIPGTSIFPVQAVCQYLHIRGSGPGHSSRITRDGLLRNLVHPIGQDPTAGARPVCPPTRRPQLPNRRGNFSSTGGVGGLPNPNFRKVAQCRLPEVHQDTKVTSSQCLGCHSAGPGPTDSDHCCTHIPSNLNS